MAYDKVVDSAFLEAGLALVGDSIRAKGGTSAKLEFPNGMKAAVEAIDTSKPEQTKTATPSLSQQTIVPDSGKTLSGVTVEPITSTLLTSLDPDFKPENIAKDANLFGLVGTHAAGPSVETCTVEVIKTVGPANIYQYSVVLYDPDTGIYSEYFHSDNNQTRAGDEDDDGGGDSAASEPFYGRIFSNVVCGTHLYLYMESPMTDVNIQVSTMGGAAFVENLRCSSGHWIVCTAPDTAGAVATISVSASW